MTFHRLGRFSYMRIAELERVTADGRTRIAVKETVLDAAKTDGQTVGRCVSDVVAIDRRNCPSSKPATTWTWPGRRSIALTCASRSTLSDASPHACRSPDVPTSVRPTSGISMVPAPSHPAPPPPPPVAIMTCRSQTCRARLHTSVRRSSLPIFIFDCCPPSRQSIQPV